MVLLDVLEDGELSDIAVTNNGDFIKVMATIFKIVRDYLNEFPENIVTFNGSEEKSQRLYRIIISKELHLIKYEFEIFGLLNNNIEIFEANKKYELYIIRKK